MSAKDLVAKFRAAEWGDAEEIESLVGESDGLTAAVVERLLEICVARAGASEQPRRLAVFERLAAEVPDKALFASYVKALRAADSSLRSVLGRLIPKVNSVSDHPLLVACLRVADPQFRKEVAPVLAAVGGRTAFDLLGDLVREPGFVGRMEAMDVATTIAPQHSIPLLQSVLSVGSEAEKVRAVAYLSDPRCHARDPSAALQALIAVMGDRSESVVAGAISAVSSLCSEEEYFNLVGAHLENSNLTIAHAAVDGLRKYPSPRAVSALHRRMRIGPSVLRFAALDALEAIGTSDTLEPLVEALGHTQITVRTRAGEILLNLGKSGKVDLARIAIWLLRSRDVNVRRMAVELVQTVRDPEGELWPKLLGYLRDEDWWVRERVMDALTEMAGENLLRHLAGFLLDPSDIIRRFGVDALLRLRSPAALGTLMRTAASRTSSTSWSRIPSCRWRA
jgi:HEAT repeat protein